MNTPHAHEATLPVPRRLPSSEAGIGLIEIVISMMLLALLATALVPVLVSGLRHASSSATLATATQLANDELERARSWTKCSDLDPGDISITDARSDVAGTQVTQEGVDATRVMRTTLHVYNVDLRAAQKIQRKASQ